MDNVTIEFNLVFFMREKFKARLEKLKESLVGGGVFFCHGGCFYQIIMILVVFEYVEKVDQWLVSVACSIFQGSLVNRESDQLFLEEKRRKNRS